MTTLLRRAGLLTLALLILAFAIVPVSPAQAQGCYPVPPGGCADADITCEDIVAAIIAGDPELDQNGDGVMDAQDLPADCGCPELLEGIAAGAFGPGDLPEGALDACDCDDLLGAVEDGTLDEGDLPDGALDACPAEAAEEPTCDDLIAGIADGSIDAADLPEGALDTCDCDVLLTAVEDGTLDAEALPDACAADDSDVAEEAPTGLADTGMDSGAMALLAIGGLLAGAVLLRTTRTA
jgi:hypothetical protein